MMIRISLRAGSIVTHQSDRLYLLQDIDWIKVTLLSLCNDPLLIN